MSEVESRLGKKGPTALTDIKVETVGLVKAGMVGKTFFLVKSADEEGDNLNDAATLEKKIQDLETKLVRASEPVEKAVNDGFLTLRLDLGTKAEIEAVAKEYGSTTSEITRYYLKKGLLDEPAPAGEDVRLLKAKYAGLLYKEFVGQYAAVEVSDAKNRQDLLDAIWMKMLELTDGDEAEATRLLVQLSRTRGSAADWMSETMRSGNEWRVEEA